MAVEPWSGYKQMRARLAELGGAADGDQEAFWAWLSKMSSSGSR